MNQPVVTREMIEASMQRARIERSNAMWSLLGQPVLAP